MAERRPLLPILALLVALWTAGCGAPPDGEPVRVRVPRGAAFAQVSDSLAARGIIRAPSLFRLYARLSRSDRSIKAGTYAFRAGESWKQILADLRAGRVLTFRIAIPEGWDLRAIVPRIAAATETPEEQVWAMVSDTAAARRYGVPGPGLEGYLYPATYTLPVGEPVDSVLAFMVAQYRRVWTPERRAMADSIGLSERDVVTLASIVEKEARVREEMPTIAAVYHNRLRIGMPLQADPTVQYALGQHQARLLYAHIDSVADHAYNTYRRRGLPPGPIASPSIPAIDAALQPAEVPFLYFVARPDGSHIFTRTLADHNRARAQIARERRAAQQAGAAARSSTPPGS